MRCSTVPDTIRRKLQSLQNATARLITGTQHSDHISPVLCKFHWLLLQPRSPDITYGQFRRQLKGHLFREAWTRHSVTSDMRHHRKTLTYLHSPDTMILHGIFLQHSHPCCSYLRHAYCLCPHTFYKNAREPSFSLTARSYKQVIPGLNSGVARNIKLATNTFSAIILSVFQTAVSKNRILFGWVLD